MSHPADLPRHDEYADDDDTRDWDVERDGRMIEYADDDDVVVTTPGSARMGVPDPSEV